VPPSRIKNGGFSTTSCPILIIKSAILTALCNTSPSDNAAVPRNKGLLQLVKDWRLFPVNEIRRPDADKQAIEIAVEMIKKAKNPLVLIGAGANRKI
jgi:thiamine pyrophosphate-dependent acetolactate synthase large subunit-like protein